MRRIQYVAIVVLVVSSLLIQYSVVAAQPQVPQPADFNPGTDAFQRTWDRTEKPISDGKVNRTWMWGPVIVSEALDEDYAESPAGTRVVQYFDKSRMEITHPDAPDDGLWYVTNGLLVVELTTGRMQVGDNEFTDLAPAAINVAGDPDDVNGVTYATLAALVDAAPAANSASITQRLDQDGNVTDDATMASHGVTAAQRVQVEGIDHQIASVFWDFMNSTGTVYENNQFTDDHLFENPYYATGYPITEAYWANVKLQDAQQDVLLQCFERRCLTYTPSNADGWKVEAGNVGQHYYSWRYVATPDPVRSTTVDVSAEDGAIVTLSDEISLDIPPGGLTTDATVTLVEIPYVSVGQLNGARSLASFRSPTLPEPSSKLTQTYVKLDLESKVAGESAKLNNGQLRLKLKNKTPLDEMRETAYMACFDPLMRGVPQAVTVLDLSSQESSDAKLIQAPYDGSCHGQGAAMFDFSEMPVILGKILETDILGIWASYQRGLADCKVEATRFWIPAHSTTEMARACVLTDTTSKQEFQIQSKRPFPLWISSNPTGSPTPQFVDAGGNLTIPFPTTLEDDLVVSVEITALVLIPILLDIAFSAIKASPGWNVVLATFDPVAFSNYLIQNYSQLLDDLANGLTPTYKLLLLGPPTDSNDLLKWREEVGKLVTASSLGKIEFWALLLEAVQEWAKESGKTQFASAMKALNPKQFSGVWARLKAISIGYQVGSMGADLFSNGAVETITISPTDAPPPAPSAPANLKAEGISKAEIKLTWEDKSNNEVGFRIYGLAGTRIDDGEVKQDGTTYTVTGLGPDEPHCYQVTAVNSAGVESAKSNSACARTKPAVVEKPAAPTNVRFEFLSSIAINPIDGGILYWSYGDYSTISGFNVYTGGCGGNVKRLVSTESDDTGSAYLSLSMDWNGVDVGCPGSFISSWYAGVSAVTPDGVESDIVWVLVSQAE